MFRKVKFSLKGYTRPFGVLVAGLCLVSAVTAAGGLWHHQQELNHQKQISNSTAPTPKNTSQNTASKSTSNNPSSVLADNTASDTSSSSIPSRTQPVNTPQQTTATEHNSAAQETVHPNAIVTLQVNGSTKGMIAVAAGSNQCDVLSQALKSGHIYSLDMQYHSNLGSYGVHRIDGIGDNNSVWWVYKVNGSPAPSGCSHITAHNGDVVHWEYLKR